MPFPTPGSFTLLFIVACISTTGAASRTRAPNQATTGGNTATAHPQYYTPVDARGSSAARPSLIDYNPVADPRSVVVASDGRVRFTLLSPRLIRMQEIGTNATAFEERATLAIPNRLTPVPPFSHREGGGVLTINTSFLTLTYTLGGGFTPSTLRVTSVDPSTSGWTSWSFGQASPGNLLGTIRGLDEQTETSLNCTVNQNVDDNGEANHCEWGLVSRDGWAVYNDSLNACLDGDDWWSVPGPPPPPPARGCTPGTAGQDARSAVRSARYPSGTSAASPAACCAACMGDPTCWDWVFDSVAGDNPNCWPLADSGGGSPPLTGCWGRWGRPPKVPCL